MSDTRRPAGLADFLFRMVKEKPLGTIGGIIVLILILVAIFADTLAPYEYYQMHLVDRLQGSSARYLLGTDHLGRDFLSRIIYGARISLTVGLAATALNVVVAVLVGGASGFFGGKVDLVVQRFVDTWMSFPGLLLLLTVMSILGKGLVQIIVVLGIAGGIGSSRVVRGAVIAIKENVYFQAAEAIGSSQWTIYIRHVLPNIVAPVIIIFSINIGGVIMSEASLSFLGFGLPPGIPSWGGMLSREGRQYMEAGPWLALWPGLFLTILVYSLNMFGDAVRDLLDPRLRGGVGRYGADGSKSL
ncbi:MAG: ABC transporter permease [Spirochaetaceae bacterium]|nr:ABC transporter permease [Spirochaetaceae bacterium]